MRLVFKRIINHLGMPGAFDHYAECFAVLADVALL